jgi:hypothetical protein
VLSGIVGFMDKDPDQVSADQRAAFMRRFERLAKANRVLTDHRLRLVLRVEALTGERWEDVMAGLGVDMGAARDHRGTEPLWGQWGQETDLEVPEGRAEDTGLGQGVSDPRAMASAAAARDQDVRQGEPLLRADLHDEDDEGYNRAVLTRSEFDPARVYPGALVEAGTPDWHTAATVLRTELHQTPGGRQVVLVTFQPGLV